MRGQTVFPFFQPPVGRMGRGRLVAQIAPRMAPAALRVPNPVHAPQISLRFPQSSPHIFVHVASSTIHPSWEQYLSFA